MIIIKKIAALLLVLVVALTAFVACTRTPSVDDTTSKFMVPTEKAKIKEANAIEFIEKNYTPQELGLEDVKENYSFMVASDGVDIDGKKYVKVLANVLKPSDVTSADGQETFTMETYGEYYIAFNGKKVLSKNMETGEYTELEIKPDAYAQKGDGTQEAQSTEKNK